MDTINVLHLGSPTGLYGAERWILALVRHLDPNRVRSIVAAIKDDPNMDAPLCTEAAKLGVETRIFEAHGRFNFSAVRQLRRYIRENDIHILHTHFYKTDLLGLLATRGTSCRLISTPHGWSTKAGFKLRCYEQLDRMLFPFMDAVVPLSPDLYASLANSSCYRVVHSLCRRKSTNPTNQQITNNDSPPSRITNNELTNNEPPDSRITNNAVTNNEIPNNEPQAPPITNQQITNNEPTNNDPPSSRITNNPITNNESPPSRITNNEITNNEKTNLRLIQNGVDISEIDSVQNIAPELQPLRMNDDFIFGYIGQIIPRKGLDVLLRALSRLPVEIPWQAAIVGEGPARGELESLAEQLGVRDRVSFFGYRENRLQFLRGFDCFVLPSSLEGIPRCLMEAMAAGVPVIASDIPGCTDLVEHRANGLLFAKQDDESLAQALKMIVSEPGARSEWAAQARELIRSRYSAERMAREYEQLYWAIA